MIKKINRYLKEHKGIGIYKIDLTRPSTQFVKNHFKGKRIDVVEIGTYKGLNAVNLLKNLKIDKLYLIDSWENYNEYNEYKNQKRKENRLNAIYPQAVKRIKKATKNQRIKIIKKYSEKALSDVEKADFIYIDGNHDYDFVKKDIENYYSKLSKNGVLGGHDINFVGVIEAVTEFAKKENLRLFISFPDWWVIKGLKKD